MTDPFLGLRPVKRVRLVVHYFASVFFCRKARKSQQKHYDNYCRENGKKMTTTCSTPSPEERCLLPPPLVIHDETDLGCENTQFASFRCRQTMPRVVTQKKPARTLAFVDGRLSLQAAAE